MNKNIYYQNEFYKFYGKFKNNKLVFFQDILMDEDFIEGDVFYGEVVKIADNLKGVFVKYFKNKIGLLPQKSSNNNIMVGDHIFVQVIRQESKDKPALLTSFIKFYGEHVDFIPNSLTSKVFARNPDIEYALLKYTGTILVKSNSIEKIQQELDNFNKILKKKYMLYDRIYSKIDYIFYEKAFEKDIIFINKILEDFHSYKINLPSGGIVYMEKTKLGYTFDVNTGTNLSVEKTNQEALEVIENLIDLKRISGIIIIDFLGTPEDKNQLNINKVFKNDQVSIKGSTIEIIKQYNGFSMQDLDYESCCSCLNGYKDSFRYIVTSLLRYKSINVKRKFLYTNNISDHQSLLLNKLKFTFFNEYISNY